MAIKPHGTQRKGGRPDLGETLEAWPSSFQAEGGCEKQQNVMNLTASGLLFDF